MKLRRQPEDFQVEELADFPLGAGPYAVYRLTKRSIGTLEAIAAISEKWKAPRRALSFGGLKDRHALTQQFVTLQGGPRRGLKQSSFSLDYLGQSPQAFSPQDIRGNRFQIVLRDLSPARAADVVQALDGLTTTGIPNYFDDQRFGSVGQRGEFPALAWCRGDHERTLKIALLEPNDHDTPEDKREKSQLREDWGDWNKLKGKLREPIRKRAATFLADNPRDFRRAVAGMPIDYRGLLVSSFQSHLWNRMLVGVLRRVFRDDQLTSVSSQLGELLFPQKLDADQVQKLDAQELPLPSARIHYPEGWLSEVAESVLTDAGIALRELRIKYPRDTFFSKGERAMLCRPEALTHQSGPDELYPDRTCVTLNFELPRGAYATILVKRVMA